ncbi:PadR family transcriptional regulator [Tissierella carlieri]|uniref:PadR family transcriptional regulator n=1 Tax=Tissierella carlieri TaxID=689904 RepID=A0ABT1SG16_9FIRM|nr:PadR family transcriptional regulator [Tissierella carlieri]MBU5311282.1 PadR family transcriptional regulator [Tissierella carlieri]MCQ4925411.1 PadR family transcriptional regulator [Tissierella carlieri]MDU5083029.1 PadR family transcriptional regulator [Bacillota bacterium]
MARTQLQNLTEPMYYILLTLTKERHGYEIMQTIEKLTEGRVVVGPGTLYSLLSRFQEEGIIMQVSDEGRRKTYIITKLGTEILEGEINRLRQLISDGEGILKYGSISEEDDTTEDKKEIKDGYKTRKSIFKRPDDDILF